MNAWPMDVPEDRVLQRRDRHPQTSARTDSPVFIELVELFFGRVEFPALNPCPHISIHHYSKIDRGTVGKRQFNKSMPATSTWGK